MSAVVVDANVIIDIATDNPVFADWSRNALVKAGRGSRLVINPLVYAEVSVAYSRIEDLDAVLPEEIFVREALPWNAAFLAGKAYLGYRRRGGYKTPATPDFYIGAHAAIRGYRLLIRDRGRYSTHFPGLELIAP